MNSGLSINLSLKKKRTIGINSKLLKVAWSKHEDDELLLLKEMFKNLTWVEIASNIQGKSPKQCSYRYCKLFGKKRYEIAWTREDDLKLIELIELVGENFEAIKPYFSNKALKDFKLQYNKMLDPKLEHFSTEEDYNLIKFYKQKFIDKDSLDKLQSKSILTIKRRLEHLIKINGESRDGIKDFFNLFINNHHIFSSEKNEKKDFEEPYQISKFQFFPDSTAQSNGISAINKCMDKTFVESLNLNNSQDLRSVSSHAQNQFLETNFQPLATMNWLNLNHSSVGSIIDGCPDISCKFIWNYPNYCTDEYLELGIKQTHINNLLEKKKCLEEVLLEVQKLSDSFFKEIELKIESCKQPDVSKFQLLGNLSLAIKLEKEQLSRLCIVDSICNLNENTIIKGLLASIDVLINLIKLTKEKFSVVRKLLEN